MAKAYDSLAGSHARRDASGETEQAGTHAEALSASLSASSHHPVFDAFDALGVTGRDVAELADVTPPTVSKWRSGKARIPGERLAFLTLALAHLIDEVQAVADLEAQCAGPTTASWHTRWAGRVDLARAYLAYQDVLNRDIDAGEVRGGAQTFRAWWTSGAAERLQRKRFRPDIDADGGAARVKSGTRSGSAA